MLEHDLLGDKIDSGSTNLRATLGLYCGKAARLLAIFNYAFSFAFSSCAFIVRTSAVH